MCIRNFTHFVQKSHSYGKTRQNRSPSQTNKTSSPVLIILYNLNIIAMVNINQLPFSSSQQTHACMAYITKCGVKFLGTKSNGFYHILWRHRLKSLYADSRSNNICLTCASDSSSEACILPSVCNLNKISKYSLMVSRDLMAFHACTDGVPYYWNH